VLELHAAEFPPRPPVEIEQHAPALGVTVERHPSDDEAVRLGDHPRDRHAAIAADDLTQAIPGSVQAFGTDAQASRFTRL
jgi:hypothetical protein